LLAVLGGGLAVLLTLVPLTVVADLLVTRGRAHTAADAAALAAMGDAVVDGRAAADGVAGVNGGVVLSWPCDAVFALPRCRPEPKARR
jgi:hypothetical protein